MTKRHFSPSFTAAASVMRQWLRLRRAAGHQRVGALRERVGDQELELAGLVAAGDEAEQVVALDPDLGPRPPGIGREPALKRGSGSSGVGPSV